MVDFEIISRSVCITAILLFGPIWAQEYPGYGHEEKFVDLYPKLFPYRAAAVYDTPNIHPDLLEEAYAETEATLKLKDHVESGIINQNGYVPLNVVSASARHHSHYFAKPKHLFEVEEYQDHLEELTKRIQNKLSMSKDEVYFSLPKFSLHGIRAGYGAIETCHKVKNVYCRESKYRNMDGSCNNPNYPTWGQAFSCFQRFLAPDYADGVSELRTSIDGSTLPNPRYLSTTLHGYVEKNSHMATHMLMQWGQVIDHDVTFTQLFLAGKSYVLDCCKPYESGYAGNLNHHPRCLPILIPPDDPFYPHVGVKCLNFVRTASCLSCALGPRTQTNQVTSFLDASGVYGNSDEEVNALRDPMDDAKFAMSQSYYGPLLSRSKHPELDQCSTKNPHLHCFAAGDARVNQHPGLGTIMTLLTRYHNIMVDRLRHVNPHWSSEILFQETRRIVIAQYQMIAFREYIHLVIGPTMMTFFDLWPLEHDRTEYNPSVNPTLYSEFSTAAYRYGHSIINKEFMQIVSGGYHSHLSLRDNYFNPLALHNGSLDSILLGLSNQPAQTFDPYLVHDLTEYAYKVHNTTSGLDLAAFNILRGRDNGMKSYIHYIKYCFDIQIDNFDDLRDLMSYDHINRLRSVYRYVQDIDLWTGALHEYRLKEAVVGPTFGCLIGQQYFFMKFGDRYYFEHGNQPGSFSEAQLKEIRKTWLSKIMCDAGDYISHVQIDVFQPVTEGNPVLSCDEIPVLNLAYWKESVGVYGG